MTYPVRIPGQAGSWAQSPTQTPPPPQTPVPQRAPSQTSIGAQAPAPYAGHSVTPPAFSLSEGSFGFRQRTPELQQNMSTYLSTPNYVSSSDWSDYDNDFADPDPVPEAQTPTPPAATPPPDPARHYEAEQPSFMSPTEAEVQYGQDQGLYVGDAEPEGGWDDDGEVDTTGDGVANANTFTPEGEASILNTLLDADNPDGTVSTGQQRDLGLGTTETGAYEDTRDDRHRAAADFGYEQGTNTGAALGTVAGTLLGVPGLGLLGAELAGDTAGDLGTTDAQGNVYDQDGNRFNPVTGEQQEGFFEALNPFDDGTQYESVGEGANAVPAASQAGLRSVAGEDSILAALNEAEVPQPPAPQEQAPHPGLAGSGLVDEAATVPAPAEAPPEVTAEVPASQMTPEQLDAIPWKDATPEQYAQKQINAWVETAPPEQMLGTQDGRVVYDKQVFDNVQAAEDHRRQKSQLNLPEIEPEAPQKPSWYNPDDLAPIDHTLDTAANTAFVQSVSPAFNALAHAAQGITPGQALGSGSAGSLGTSSTQQEREAAQHARSYGQAPGTRRLEQGLFGSEWVDIPEEEVAQQQANIDAQQDRADQFFQSRDNQGYGNLQVDPRLAEAAAPPNPYEDYFTQDHEEFLWGNSGWDAHKLASVDDATRERVLDAARDRRTADNARLDRVNNFNQLAQAGGHDFQEGMTGEQFANLPPAFQNNILRDAEIRAHTRKRSEAEGITGVGYDTQSGQFQDSHGNSFADAQQAQQSNIEIERFQREQARLEQERLAAEQARREQAQRDREEAAREQAEREEAARRRAEERGDTSAQTQHAINIGNVNRQGQIHNPFEANRGGGGDSGGGGGGK